MANHGNSPYPPAGYPPVNQPYPPTTSNTPPAGYPPVNHPYPPSAPPAGYPPVANPGQPPMGYPGQQPHHGGANPGQPPMGYPGQQPHHAGASSASAPGYAPLAAAAQMQQPVNDRPVVVIDSKFLTPTIVDLVVSRKMSLKEGQFEITDLQGNLVFKVRGKMFSLHDKRVLVDSQEKPIISFQQKILTAHRRWNAFRGESSDLKDLIFTVKKSSILQFGTGLHVFLAANNSKDKPDFVIKGSFSESSCTIFAADGKTVLCQMRRQHNSAGSILFGMDKFGVTVYPKVDVAFIVALVVILEEINQDRNGED